MTVNHPSKKLAKSYIPSEAEEAISALWSQVGAFQSKPASNNRKPYSIVIPPPNVTAALHLGHALNNTIQDVLIRYHRMKNKEVLWQAGKTNTKESLLTNS